VVISMTVPGKCYAISDGDRQDDPLHNLAHAGFIISKISYSTKPTVILHFSTTAAFRLWPTVARTQIHKHTKDVFFCAKISHLCNLLLCICFV
jgi:hypothetical protein